MIGVFDSGIGGLTVVKELFRLMPGYKILYFGDTARAPYGVKGKETIIKYASEDAEFLIKKGAKIIIIACNTASAVATETLREKFLIPIFEVVSPAIRRAVKVTRNNKIGVIGTRATMESKIYEKLIKKINPKIQVFSYACPLLVSLAEEGWLKRPETKRIIKRYLYPLRIKQIDTLILGCTHYPLFKDLIQIKIGRKVKLVDSGKEAVGEVRQYLKDNSRIRESLEKSKNHEFYFSDLNPRVREISSRWIERGIKPKAAKI